LSAYCIVEPDAVRIEEDTMDAQEILAQAKDTMTVKRVFGEPYEKNGLTLVPVAAVAGGAGAGGGEAAAGNGTGGGFGVRERPVGVYVIRENQVSWLPAVDVTRLALGGQIVAIVALLVIRSIMGARRRARA
jgi:uncharacterized spore protein YtfJ